LSAAERPQEIERIFDTLAELGAQIEDADELEETLDEREAKLDEREGELDECEKELDQRETALAAREARRAREIVAAAESTP
jgi:aminoglycoside phosphotransferase (APT) family kinase protein